MAFFFHASAFLWIMDCKCLAATYQGTLERCQDKDFKPPNSTALLLFPSDKPVLGHCQSQVAVVPLPHDLKERRDMGNTRSNAEPVSVRQDTCLAFGPLTTTQPLGPMATALRRKAKLLTESARPRWSQPFTLSSSCATWFVSSYTQHPGLIPFPGNSKPFPVPGPSHPHPLHGAWLLNMCLIAFSTWFRGRLFRSLPDHPTHWDAVLNIPHVGPTCPCSVISARVTNGNYLFVVFFC